MEGNTLSSTFPKLAKEWDYERNGELTPQMIASGSHKEVYWICPICHQSYKMKVCNRTAPSKQKSTQKCPVCLGRTIIPGYNSLKALYPKIVVEEWDYEKNVDDPDAIPAHRNKKYWWICPNGHSYQVTANNKTSGNGGNCPYCSHQRLTVEHSLAIVNPDLSKEWDYEHNGELTPYDISANSSKKVWWKCVNGHSWQATVDNRAIGRGCPICAKGRHTSFPEQLIYRNVRDVFPDTISEYKLNGVEIDVFIPSLRIGIEYDGEFYHRSEKRYNNDLRKNALLSEQGITLVRVRETGCHSMSDENCVIYSYKYDNDYNGLSIVIGQLIQYLCTKAGIRHNKDVKIDEYKNLILKDISAVPKGEDLASLYPSLVDEWDFKANYPLTPQMFLPKSSKKTDWICKKCGYHWETMISSRTKGYGYPRCAKRQHYTTAEWIEKAREVHGDLYDYSLVEYHSSKEPVKIICRKHGVFLQTPSEHLLGKGCRFCANQDFHPNDSLAKLYPEIAKEWDYELNKESGYTPETIGINHTIKFYWHCNFGKPHSYKATIASRVYRKTQCAVCHGKQIDITISVAYLRPDLAKEWCKENELKPSEVSIGSEKKILWKCPVPYHKPYLASVYNRAHLHSDCPECAGNKKSHTAFAMQVNEKFPTIELLTEYSKSSQRVKCRCKVCGYEWSPFPYNLLKGKGRPKCYKMGKQCFIK